MALTRWTFAGKVMSLLFTMLSRLVITFLPRSKCLLIAWLQSPSAVILELKKIKSVTVSIVSPSICHEVMGPVAMILVFWMLSFKPTFSLSSFTCIKRLFSSSLSSIMMVSSAYVKYWYFSQQSWFQFVLHPAQHFAKCALHPEVGLLDHMVVQFLIYWRTFTLFSIIAVANYVPTKSVHEFLLPTSLPTLVISYFFDKSS